MEVNESKTSAEANAAKSSAHPGDVRRVLGRKPSGTAKRSGNCVSWQVSTAKRVPTARVPTDSDAWGEADGNTSSQSAPPPTPTPTSHSPFDELDHWSTPSPSPPVDHFDLFGTPDGTPDGTPSASDSQANTNAKYDPFSDIWAEDEDHHFW